jgi:ribosomal-protein-alanine N-acetyltransferase
MSLVSQPAIRPARPKDMDALMELERESPTAAHWSRAQYEAISQPEAPPRLCLVAESGPVLAFLVAQTAGPEWELENIVVAPSARRQGLGTHLLRELLNRARQQHALAVVLEVRASNDAARALYQACGFVEAGTRSRYYQTPREDAIICRCDLKPAT